INPFIGHPHFSYAIDSIVNDTVLDRLTSEAHTIIHLAAAVGVNLIVENPVQTIETNIMGTERVLRAALRYRAKVLIASTSEVYGKGSKIPFQEEDDVLLGPTSKSRWGYAASKMVDEFLGLAYHHEYGLPVVILRLFNTVGPGQTGRYGMVIPRFVRQALNNEPITVYGDGTQRRCFCDARDVIRAIMALAENDAAVGRVFNIGGTEEISMNDLAQRVIRITGAKSQITFIPYDKAYAPGFEDMRRRVPDTSRINKLIGWTPSIPLDDILRSVMEHFKASPGHV
ncbi:MAG: NAD-dependent epimerase/dehydratase family protein, partial [Candidatus Binatia bacterium]